LVFGIIRWPKASYISDGVTGGGGGGGGGAAILVHYTFKNVTITIPVVSHFWNFLLKLK
jgi:hypothetical protein